MNSIKTYWIDLNRFDSKMDKSTWLEISEALYQNNFNVTIMCGYQREKYKPKEYKVNIRYFKSLRTGGLFRYSLLLRIILWLLRNSRSNDIIIVCPRSLIVGFVLKYLKGCHIHMDVRTVPVEIHGIKDKIDRFLFWKSPLKFFSKLPDSNSFITKSLKESMEKEFCVRYDDYVTWHSGVNIQMFQTHNQACTFMNKDKFVLFYHGSVTPNRGLDLVLNGLAKLKPQIREQILFKIIGNGYDLERLKMMAMESSLNVCFEGYIPYEKIPSVIKEADCCICPLPDLQEWNVSSPIKVFEYLACAKPVILTPIEAHKQIANNKDYVIWTNGFSVDDFAKAIQFAYTNRDKLKVKAKGALDFIQGNYDWKVQGNKFAKYLKENYEIN
ncbi:MAG: glycosyltransferase family 4 protein [Candidatus Brocadiaceae bacterium]|nr:glycosyltransferase family 4 protein [Candidatus Brocadiaceae bacterium]